VRVLVIDVGGTHIKVAGSWDRVTHRIPSGPKMTATEMVRGVLDLTSTWDFEAISLGYPGPVKDNRPFKEPVNIGSGWTTIDFQKAFGKPVRCINDAAMQALGSFSGGRMLFLGLGTGLGTSIVDHWRVEPLEIAHLPYRKDKSYEEYLGDAGMKELGDERWEKHVHRVCDLFRAALLCDGIVLGGGNARKLRALPEAATRGSNENAIIGGIRLWERPADNEPFEFAGAQPARTSRAVARKKPVRKKTAAKKTGAKRTGAKRTGAKRTGAKKTRAKTSTTKNTRSASSRKTSKTATSKKRAPAGTVAKKPGRGRKSAKR
jgi:polyphosphate glucokinase